MQIPDNLPPDVARPLRRFLAEIGTDVFSMNDVIEYIERNRRKHLRIELDTMPVSMTGYVIALRDCDLICTRPDLSETQRIVTKLHEMSHLIRGDIPLLSLGEETTTYEQFIVRRDRHQIAQRRDRFLDMYNDEYERNTELLARRLLKSIRNYEKRLPPEARQFYHGE